MVKEALCGRNQKRVDDEGRCQCRDEDDAGEGQIADIGRYRLPCEEPIAQGEKSACPPRLKSVPVRVDASTMVSG